MNRKFILYVATFLVFNIATSVASRFPSSIKKCNYEESSCIKQSIQNALITYAKTGVKELNVRKFDPLRISSLILEKNPQSPVNIELKFKDVDLIGLQNAKVTKVTGFDASAVKIIEIHAYVKELILQGPYSIDGRVLILPIVGKGKSRINLHDLDIVAKFRPKTIVRGDGHTYLRCDGTKLLLTPKRVNFNLENLFNGDKSLGDNMNIFINENWSDIFNELRPDLSEAIGLVITAYINEAFSKLPYEEYFL